MSDARAPRPEHVGWTDYAGAGIGGHGRTSRAHKRLPDAPRTLCGVKVPRFGTSILARYFAAREDVCTGACARCAAIAART